MTHIVCSRHPIGPPPIGPAEPTKSRPTKSLLLAAAVSCCCWWCAWSQFKTGIKLDFRSLGRTVTMLRGAPSPKGVPAHSDASLLIREAAIRQPHMSGIAARQINTQGTQGLQYSAASRSSAIAASHQPCTKGCNTSTTKPCARCISINVCLGCRSLSALPRLCHLHVSCGGCRRVGARRVITGFARAD
jgi:hypothetical protein